MPLGALVARFDHRGGEVLTLHHAVEEGEGPLANELPNQDKLGAFREERSAEYDHRDYSEGFPARRKALFQTEDTITDAYTGRELPKDGRTHLDHVRAAHEIHEDDALTFHLGAEGKRRVATSDANVVPTARALNQSKGDRPLDEWAESTRKDGQSNAERFASMEVARRRWMAGRARTSTASVTPRRCGTTRARRRPARRGTA